MAYDHVNPNFHYGGQWFSKKRYGICYWQGKRFPWNIAEQRMVDQPLSEDNSFDPVDWTQLMDEYLYWKARYAKQGYRLRHHLLRDLALAG